MKSAGKPMTKSWTQKEFESKIRDKWKYYHIHHPFDVLMNSGKLDKPALQAWVANRFYYHAMIPRKDAAILANCDDRNVRREWIHRIIEQDGTSSKPGGLDAWLQLSSAVGLSKTEVLSFQHVLPSVRFAVDAYLSFAQKSSWQEGVCSSLTELFAPAIHKKRLAEWPKHYPWIQKQGYEYFKKRLSEAPNDVKHGLSSTLKYFDTREKQERALEIVQFKLDVLWTILDALEFAYVFNRKPYWNIKS